MRSHHVGLVLALLGVACLPAPLPGASASCAAPEVDVARGAALQRGTTLTVAGQGFLDGCDDSGTCAARVGCSGCAHKPDEVVAPLAAVPLTLVQGERRWQLAGADADHAGDVSWTVVLPDDATVGAAQLVTPVSQGVPVRMR